MKRIKLFWSMAILSVIVSCAPVEYEEIENLAAEFGGRYEISSLESHLGSGEVAEGDDIDFTTVNDSTVNVLIGFTSFNSGNDFTIEGLKLYQSGQYAKFDQDFGNANISGGIISSFGKKEIRINIDYENEDFVHILGEEK